MECELRFMLEAVTDGIGRTGGRSKLPPPVTICYRLGLYGPLSDPHNLRYNLSPSRTTLVSGTSPFDEDTTFS